MLDSSYSILCANLAGHHHVKTAHSFLCVELPKELELGKGVE